MFDYFFSKDTAGNMPQQVKAPPPYFVTAATAPAVTAPADSVFDPAKFPFADRAYRIHFKNGHSGEYAGVVLAQSFPFDPAQVERVEHVENVGQ